jgi:hypothetical protein
MHVPEACIPGGFKQQVHDDVVVVTDAIRRQIVRGDEGTKILLRSGAGFEGLGSGADHVEELRESAVGIGRNRRSRVLLLGMHAADCGQHESDCNQNRA